ADSRTPASTIAVRSPGSCSSRRFRRAVESRTSPPGRSIDTRPPPVSTSTASSTEAGSATLTSETLCNTCSLHRMCAVRPPHPAAEPRRGQHLARVREPGRVEGLAEAVHHREVVGAEELGHRAHLVDADAVLAGERAARVDADVEDRGGAALGALGLALDAVV